jgi:hypothetical protein
MHLASQAAGFYREAVLLALPHLLRLDAQTVTAAERRPSATLVAQMVWDSCIYTLNTSDLF